MNIQEETMPDCKCVRLVGPVCAVESKEQVPYCQIKTCEYENSVQV
jgi:hypothetical protein